MNHEEFFTFAGLMACSVAICLAVELLITGLSLRALLLSLILLSIASPLVLRHMRGCLDIFEPLVLADIALAVMFIARPLADLATGRTRHLGVDITGTFDKTLLVVLAGVVAFQLGYCSRLGYEWARSVRAPGAFNPQTAARAAWFFFMLGGALFGVFLAKGGGTRLLLQLLVGRSGVDNGIFVHSTGYFTHAILMWAASALIFFALASAIKQRRYFVWFAAVTLPLVIFFGARGSRSQLLPLTLAVPTFWYLWNNRRPPARTILVALFVGMILMTWQRETRTAGSADRSHALETLSDVFASPQEDLGNMLSGADTEMFDSLANELTVVPDKLGYRYGGSLTDLFIRAVPRPLWPNKPLETNDAVVNALWPEHYKLCRASAAFSVLGPFYADSGFFGVVLGMFGIGVLFETLWLWYLRHRRNLNATLIYSMALPFTVILMRGTLPGALSRALFMVVPLILLMKLSRFRLRAPSTQVRRPHPI